MTLFTVLLTMFNPQLLVVVVLSLGITNLNVAATCIRVDQTIHLHSRAENQTRILTQVIIDDQERTS